MSFTLHATAHPSLAFFVALTLAGLCLLLLFVLVALARRKQKSSRRKLALVGRAAAVERALRPEGFVLIDGELWPARARSCELLEGVRVRVVGVSGHFLEVESDG